MGLASQLSGMRVRLRLTLLYGVLFVFSGAVLLSFLYFLVARSGTNVVTSSVRQVHTPDSELPAAAGRATLNALQEQAVQQQHEIMHQLLVQSCVALAIMSVISVALGWLMAGRVLRPLQTMTATIQRISARNVHERLAATGAPDELKNLSDTVDGLLGRLEVAIESHRRFVANAAHELRTPLTVEHALLEEAVIDRHATVDSYRAQFEQLMVVSEQQARLLESLLVLATSERGLDRDVGIDLSMLTCDVLRAAEPKARQRRVDFATDLRPARLTGDPALVERLVANLVDNATSYNIPEGRVEVVTGTAGGRPFMQVTNTGPQVPPDMVELLLNPFQRLDRTADDDGHHGLGLSIVNSIAAAHGADLTVRARPEGGLAIRVDFQVDESLLKKS